MTAAEFQYLLAAILAAIVSIAFVAAAVAIWAGNRGGNDGR